MKKTIFILSFLLSSFFTFMSCNAQVLKVTYDETMDLSEKLAKIDNPAIKQMVIQKMGEPKQYELISSNGISIYQIQAKEEAQSNVIVNSSENVIYRDHKNKLLVDQTDFMSRTFLIEDKLDKKDWKITDKTSKIGDYSCRKATLIQGESQVTAWFTPEIPSNEGPKNYYGLPGLILKVETKLLTIEATKIQLLKEQVKITRPTKGKKVTREEFDKIRDEKIKSLKGDKKSEGVQIIRM